MQLKQSKKVQQQFWDNKRLLIRNSLFSLNPMYSHLFFVQCPQNRIGNYLCTYFTCVSYQLKYYKIAKVTHFLKNELKMPSIINIKDLCCKKKDCTFEKNDYEFTVHFKLSQWGRQNNVLSGISPIIRCVLTNIFPKPPPNNQNNIIIHLRMSDSPFNRHKRYHFMKNTFFNEAFNIILKNKKNEFPFNIKLLCNFNHNAKISKIIWQQYLNYFNTFFTNKKFINTVEIISDGTIHDDFSLMLHSQYLISTGSSMSAMAAFGSSGISILPMSVRWKCKKKILQKQKVFFINGGRLDHNQVYDYVDVMKVIKLLQ